MKTTTIALLAAVLAFSASSFRAEAADAVDTVPVPVEFTIPAAETNWYLGGIAGVDVSGNNPVELGVVGGFDVNRFFSIETRYVRPLKGPVDDRLTAGVVLGTDIDVFKPYVHAGAGYEWGEKDRTVYSVGVGSKLHVSPAMDIDFRYSYIDGFAHKNEQHVISTGIEFRF